jgi:hypothetical protein
MNLNNFGNNILTWRIMLINLYYVGLARPAMRTALLLSQKVGALRAVGWFYYLQVALKSARKEDHEVAQYSVPVLVTHRPFCHYIF